MERITEEYMCRSIEKFLSMEFNWIHIGESPWDERSYLLDLPKKWELSFALERDLLVVGYIIGSQVNSRRAKVNKIVVDGEYRGRGFGRELMQRFEEECSNNGISEVELKALDGNISANNFYAKLGYQLTGSIEGSDGKMRNVYIKRLE